MILESIEIDIIKAATVLNHLRRKKIFSVIHPADSLLIFKFGLVIGEEDGRKIYRYSLSIWGKWIYRKDGSVVNSWPISSSDKGFFMRMEDFANNFSANHVEDVEIDEDGQGIMMQFDDQSSLTMWPQDSGFLNYYEYLQDQLDESSQSLGIRTDEVSQKLVFFRADNRRPGK